MTDIDAYAPTKVDLRTPDNVDLTEAAEVNHGFYVVSQRKFLILYVATLGLYRFYWFYKQWQCYKEANKEEMWPIARAIFSIFTVHALFEAVHRAALKREIKLDWVPRELATFYVILKIIGSVCDRLAANNIGEPYADIVYLIAELIICGQLFFAQGRVNQACGAPEGSNSKLSGANYFWIVIGCLAWVMVLLGTGYLPNGGGAQ